MDAFNEAAISYILGYEWCLPPRAGELADSNLVHYRPFSPGTVAVKSTEGWLVLCVVRRVSRPGYSAIERKPVKYEELNTYDKETD